MKNSMLKSFSSLMIVALMLTGCSSTKVAKDWNGVGSPDGQVLGHVSTTNWGLHLLVGRQPLAGDASLEKTVSDFTAAAKAQGASKVRIVQSHSTAYWFIFFPFTLLITPVNSNVAGDAIQ